MTTRAVPRHELRWAVGLCVVGSLVALEALGRGWLTYESSGGLTIERLEVRIHGGQVAHAAQAAAVLALAGVLLLVAARGWVRRLVGAVIALAGVAVCAGALRGLVRDGSSLAASALADGCANPGSCATAPQHVEVVRAWPALTLLAGLLLLASGLLAAVRGGRWAGLGSTYEAPGAREPEPATDKGAWDALDRGDDPTA
ncbi:MAG TPA: Trp biosynthesis-associated membrane protein [Mycobacteriales bacterium]|nr:Trp biosynthesis-associated membrane protein [Mycobacteriales bacterium]